MLPIVVGLLGILLTVTLYAVYSAVTENAVRAAARAAVERVGDPTTGTYRSFAQVQQVADDRTLGVICSPIDPDLPAGVTVGVEVVNLTEPSLTTGREGHEVRVTLRCYSPAVAAMLSLAAPVVDLDDLAVTTRTATSRWE